MEKTIRVTGKGKLAVKPDTIRLILTFEGMQDEYDRAYNEHRDQVGDWQNEQQRADEDYWNQYDHDYNQYSDERNLSHDNYWNEQQMDLNEQQMDYQKERDKVADEQWQKEFDEAKRQYDEQMALKEKSSSGGPGGSRGTNPDKNEESEMSVADEYLKYKKNGASSRELDAFLKAAIAEGKISQAEATEIRNQRY